MWREVQTAEKAGGVEVSTAACLLAKVIVHFFKKNYPPLDMCR